MLKKLASYVLLSFLSFSVATTLFHTVANAQTSERIPAPAISPAPTPMIILTPTPTTLPSTVKFKLQSVEVPQPTETPKPTQTIKEVKAAQTQQTQIAVTPTPTALPTIVPTAIPTPTATPQPQPAVAVPADLEPFFDKYSAEYSVDKEDLKRIAKCEAGFNPNADTGLYAGMYQFAAETWISTRSAMGLDTNPDLRKNAEESIKTAAFKIKNGGRGAWPNC